MRPTLHLTRTLLKIFMRDRQALFIGLFFPLVFLFILGGIRDQAPEAIPISIADHASNPVSSGFIAALGENPMFEVTTGDENALKEKLLAGDETLVLVIPETFSETASPTELVIYVDAAQVRLLNLILPTLKEALLGVERKLRGSEALFSLRVEDVKARSQRYIDFLLPGLLAFTLMQVSIAGSGFNIVEYRRKGILKRLFVTPIRPAEFIAAICSARLVWCLLQITILLCIAVFGLDVEIVGSLPQLYLLMILGAIIFLCMGFCVGSIAKTQQAVGAIGNLVIFPQLFLSGVFFPIEAMPGAIQPLANLLPLTYVVDSMRLVANDGLALTEILPSLAGVGIWLVICFLLATRLFVWKEVVR